MAASALRASPARARHLAIPILILCAVSACTVQTNREESLPTIDEAHGFLARIVALAQRRDFDGLCAIGDGNCERLLDVAGRNAVPPTAPTVVGVRVVPSTRTGDQVSTGGVVLALCGTDGASRRYYSEMLVFREGSTLRAINPVYWGNMTISGGNTAPAATEGPPPSC